MTPPAEPPDIPRQRGPLGERLTDAELGPIRVHPESGGWQVHYGSYVQGYYATRAEAVAVATEAAEHEQRELIVEDGPPA